MELLDARRMQEADRIAIEEMRIPGLVLMENAGRLVAEALLDGIRGLEGLRVAVVAGRGNNGGDGFVVARHLARCGVEVEVLLIGSRLERLSGDAAAMAAAWNGTGGSTRECPDAASWREAAPLLEQADVIVDALFGTGLSRPVSGLAARAVEAVNDAGDSGSLVVAVDLPSGLFGSESRVPGAAVRADATVTFARPKPAHVLPPAEELCGDVILVDIGIPDGAISRAGSDLHLVLPEEAALLLPIRDDSDHKGRFGHVLAVGGSVGKAGAAALTGLGALRAGAGLVTVAAPAPARAEVSGCAPELMTEPLDSARGGTATERAGSQVLELARRASVIALGPGLGTSAATQRAIRHVVARSTLPVVLDADGINAFGGRSRVSLRRHRAPLVITPHPGEAARLAGVEIDEIQADRVGWARRLARDGRCVCVLKGHRTVIADETGRAFVNPTGNPGMASGGTGDTLTGMIAGLIAQLLDPLDAAILGTFLHGMAADLALETAETEQTLTATGLLTHLPDAYRELTSLGESDEGTDGGDD